ncbi:MAG: hypothetical protein WBW47_08750 [Thermoplasmata archaeon]
MRTGLVVIGAVLALLGAGLIVTLFFLSGGPVTSSQISFEAPSLAGHSNQTWVVSGPSPGTGSVTLSWSTGVAANVSLWPATTCVGPMGSCPTGPPDLSWVLATSGKETVSPSDAPVYILLVTNPGNNPLRFSAVVSVTSSSGSPLTAWSWGLIATGGVALLAIGGIALFLGLFLPGGVYRDPDGEVEAVRHPSLPPEEYDRDPDDPVP